MLEPTLVAVPTPGSSEVLVRVVAAGINGPDLAQRRGHYDPPPGASMLLGLEVSGHIVAVGAAVTDWQIGDSVVALTNGGGYADYVAVPQGQVLPLPGGWSLVDGAALPETWFTITQTLVMRAGLADGMAVLVHGAAGGIGGAAVQICKILGALPIAVVSSAEKALYAKKLGAFSTIDRTRENVVDRVMALTQGRGVDRVVDIAGGDTTAINIAASALGGHILQVSTLADSQALISLRAMMVKQLTLSGSTLRPQSAATKAAIAARIRIDLWPAIGRAGFVRPMIRRFVLNDAPAAHRAMEQKTSFGKIVLLTDYGSTLEP